MLKALDDNAVTAGPRRPAGTHRLRFVIVAVAATAAIFIAGCSSSSSATESSVATTAAASTASSAVAASTASPSSSAELCAARDRLKASLSALVSPSLLTGGVAGIKVAIGDVQTSLQAVTAAAKDDNQPQVSAVRSALAQLQTAMGSLGNGGLTVAGLKTVGTDIAVVGTSTSALLAQLTARCGS